MDKWLLANLAWFVSVVVVASIAYWRLGNLEKDVKEHLDKENTAPHPACPVHSTKFDELVRAMEEIKGGLKMLDNRIYDFMRSNGYHKDTK